MNNMVKYLIIMNAFIVIFHIKPLIVGSKSAVSSHAAIVFPSTDTNNTILGFAQLEEGFALADNFTSCTFDGFMPVYGDVNLNTGQLYLRQDLILGQTSEITTPGKIFGSNHTLELPQDPDGYSLPSRSATAFNLRVVDTENMFASVAALDWSYDSLYIAGGSLASAANQEIKIYYFDGNVLTTTASIELGIAISSVSWHPTLPYLAIGQPNASGHDLHIYRHERLTATMNKTNGVSIGTVTAVAWSPDGAYLMVGKGAGGTDEIIVYSFDPSNGTINQVARADLAPNRSVNNNALSINSAGTAFVIGTSASTSAGANELVVYSFNGTTLTSSAFVNLNISVQGVAWSPTSNYIAVGLRNTTTTRIRIYQYDPAGPSLTLIPSGNVTETQQVTNLAWDPSGNYLSVGINNGITSRIDIYLFNATNVTLTKLISQPSSSAIYISRWSRNNRYIAWGNNGNVVTVAEIAQTAFFIDNTTLVLNSDTSLEKSCYMSGTCRINGNNKKLVFNGNNNLLIRPQSTIIFDNVDLYNLKNNNLRCLHESSNIIMRNSSVNLSTNFTFSIGSILFDGHCTINGSSQFIFSPRRSSTIAANACLMLGNNLTFSYSPSIARNNLLFFENNSSFLWCDDGTTLHSTRTGINITTGSIILDGKVTFSSEGRSQAEALRLGSNVNICALSNSLLNLEGTIVYN